MTNGAKELLGNKLRERIAEKERMNERYIAAQKLEHDKEQQALNRQNARKIARNRDIATIVGSSIGTAGKIAANDPAWYKRFVTNIDEFVRIPTYDRLGSHRFRYRYNYIDADGSTTEMLVPGIMIYSWMPTVGHIELQYSNFSHGNEPINQTLARLKEKVLSLNSRSSVNWEAADLGFNFMATADIMTLILELGRVIKVYQTYHGTNAYFAKAVISALGFNYSDVSANYAEYRKTYALLARKFNSAIVAPAEASFYARRAYLADNIFSDSDNKEYPRQLYAFKQAARMVLRDDATGCNCMGMSSTQRNSIVTYLSVVNEMFTRITDNPDFIEMYQDLRHAFGSKLIQLPESVEGETITVNTDSLNREQIENLMVLPLYLRSSTNHTYPTIAGSIGNRWDLEMDSAGYLFQHREVVFTDCDSALRPFFNSTYPYLEYLTDRTKMKKVYNTFGEAPSGDEILDITRLNYSLYFRPFGEDEDPLADVIDCGTEVISEAVAYYFMSEDDGEPNLDFTSIPTVLLTKTTRYDSLLLERAAVWSAFDWAHIYTAILFNDQDVETFIHTLCDTHTTFEITVKDLNRINEACVLSEFYVPDSNFGKWN